MRRIHQGLADVTPSEYDLGQIARQRWLTQALAGALEQRLHRQGAQGRFLGRFPQHHAATDERQRSVPGPDRHRKIESRDDANHAQRLPGFHHAVAGTLAGNGQAMELARQAHGKVADVDHLLYFVQAF